MQDQKGSSPPDEQSTGQLQPLAQVEIRNLPLFQGKVTETISLLDDPDSDFYQLIDQMSPDITAKFIEIAGSSLSGQKIHSIDHAVRLLGFEQMKQILTTSVLVSHLDATDIPSFHLDKFHKQAQLCAGIAVCLGRIVDHPDKAKLFTVALLHNIGKLIIALYFGEKFDAIIDLKRREGLSSSAAEKRILGLNHGEIGALVLEQCHLPRDIYNAVRFHEDESAAMADDDEFQLLLIVRKASELANRFALPEREMTPQTLPGYLRETIDAGQALHQSLSRNLHENQSYRQIIEKSIEKGGELIAEELGKLISPRHSG